MLKKALVLFICLLLALQMAPVQASAAETAPASNVVFGDFVDITINIDSTAFNVFALNKKSAVAAYADGAATFAQMDSIVPLLGFAISYDKTTKTLTAKTSAQTFVVRSGSYSYIVNGKAYRFVKPPKEKNGRLMVPAEELFKTLGYNVQVDAVKKTVHIYKFKDYNIGSFLFYNKKVNDYNYYRLEKTGLYSEIYRDVDINAMYIYNGMILGYVYDRVQHVNKLVRYDNGKFVDLIKNFDVVDTFEFGGSRVFYGFDNSDKKYKLFRYSGSYLTLVVGDCFSTAHIVFKNSIILNRYDSDRNYSIVKVDSSWNITPLQFKPDNKMTIKEYFISDDWLYVKVRPQEGTQLYFLVTNGIRVFTVEVINPLGIPVENLDFSKIRVCGGNLYVVLPDNDRMGKLFRLDGEELKQMGGDYYDDNISAMESYNGKLYLSASYKNGGTKYGVIEYVPEAHTFTVLEEGKFKNKNFAFDKSLVDSGTLFLTGKYGSWGDGSPKEKAMYVLRGDTWNYAMDVNALNSVTKTGKGLYLKVTDFDRATTTQRNSVLFIKGEDKEVNISNAAINYNITNQAVVGNAFIFAGANGITKRPSVSEHIDYYDDLILDFNVTYWYEADDNETNWNNLSNKVFVGGRQGTDTSLYRIGATATLIKKSFDTKKVFATKDPNLFLVYGNEMDKSLLFNGSPVLYLYNAVTGTFTLVSVGLDIQQILMIN